MIKGVSETNKKKGGVQKVDSLGILLVIWDACILWNLLTGKGITRAVEVTIRQAEDTIWAGHNF